ncbi:unnamed protein product [Sympodiomycopsis kandeliae]
MLNIRCAIAAAAVVLPFLSDLASAAVPTPSSPWLPAPSASGTVASPSSSGSQVNAQWEQVLGSNLYYYDVQRSGVLPDNFRIDWRNNSVLTDGQSVGRNLSGGFFDAGNFIKAMPPLAWTLTQIAYSAVLWGQGFEDAGQAYYLDSTLRNGLDWIMNASSANETLDVFVGNQSVYWGGDLDIPQPRDVYTVTSQNPGTDVFAEAATALAAGALVYYGRAIPMSQSANGSVPASLRDTAYADRLSARAVELMNLAETSTPQQVYQKAVPDVEWAYPSTDYDDEIMLGSAFVAMASGDIEWVTKAIDAYSLASPAYPPRDGVLNWDGKGPLVAPTLARLALAMPGADSRLSFSKFQSDAEIYLDALESNNMQDTSRTKGGLAYFKGYSSSASLNPALNSAWLSLMYAPLASSDTKRDSYRSYAQSQIDYTFGKNPLNTVYQVGLHPNSPVNPHSALASGGDDLQNINTDPPEELHVLYGAVVGGPDENDKYYDERDDYDQSEPALDTVAPMVGISSYFASQGSSAADPYYVGVTAPRIVSKRSGSGLSGGAIAGIVIGVLLAVAILAVVAFFIWRKRGGGGGGRLTRRRKW